jgi:hypothetical protein
MERCNLHFLFSRSSASPRYCAPSQLVLISKILLEDACEMIEVVFVELYAKIVDNEGEADGVPIVPPVSWCDSALAVTCFVKAFGKEILCNDASLWEVVHSMSYFAENIAIRVHFVTECVFINDVLWEEFESHPEVLVAIYGHHEVEVLDVDGHELCIGHGDDAAE